ncbi:beta-lactamase superfamily domain-containing protein [Pilobolus umbonatus]|nr:beta-lactamase superfamily domain-containing protein [Pilobolus umbonatus]
MHNKRPSFINFPIPFDHPYIIPTLAATVTCSALVYYSLQSAHKAELKETIRKHVIHKRRHLARSEDRYASLKIDKQYVNPFKEWNEPHLTWKQVIWKWLASTLTTQPEMEGLPVMKPSLDSIHDHTTFTWLGESTCLISMDGLIILTDPVLEVIEAVCPIKDLENRVDIVLITHNHRTHLDPHVMKYLGNRVTYYIPMGLREWFQKRQIENVIELDWWQEIHHKDRPDLLIACVPAMHTSHGSFFNEDQSLWCSFILKSHKDRIFICGNTGYVPDLFKSIKDLYSPFTLAALPISSLSTRSDSMTLQQAKLAHQDLGSPFSIGIHWRTFLPVPPLLAARNNLPNWNHKIQDTISVSAVGETIVFSIK